MCKCEPGRLGGLERWRYWPVVEWGLGAQSEFAIHASTFRIICTHIWSTVLFHPLPKRTTKPVPRVPFGACQTSNETRAATLCAPAANVSLPTRSANAEQLRLALRVGAHGRGQPLTSFPFDLERWFRRRCSTAPTIAANPRLIRNETGPEIQTNGST